MLLVQFLTQETWAHLLFHILHILPAPDFLFAYVTHIQHSALVLNIDILLKGCIDLSFICFIYSIIIVITLNDLLFHWACSRIGDHHWTLFVLSSYFLKLPLRLCRRNRCVSVGCFCYQWWAYSIQQHRLVIKFHFERLSFLNNFVNSFA